MRRNLLLLVLPMTMVGACVAGCPSNNNSSASTGTSTSHTTTTTTTTTSSSGTGGHDGGVKDAGPIGHFCNLPGSVRFTVNGIDTVPGGKGSPDLSYIKLPTGFCFHYYGTVNNARQLRFAPGGELFVASPTTITTGGGAGGLSAIVLIPDDDNDGYGDSTTTFLDQLPSTQGLMFANGYFYYQDHTKILRRAYNAGERAPKAPPETVVDIQIYVSALHWPKTMDMADDGTIYVGNGGDEGESCDPTRPFHGGVVKLDGSPNGYSPVTKGFRNPIAVRCGHGKNQCFAVELAKDYTADSGGREKLITIKQDEDWGFPCCATKGVPYSSVKPTPNCSNIASEPESFVIGNTPFGLAIEPGIWPAPYTGSMFVPLHGSAGSWEGARMVAIQVDATSGLPVPGSNLDGGTSAGGMSDFATGWDDGTLAHGRPASVTFADDGRLFLGNDNSGDIVWIAPLEM